ncbi:MAG: hypothetical protein K9J13_05440 [Saprospiraceae bacterium]|nr:hypothetical protein [Saprospiraceae bacterium]
MKNLIVLGAILIILISACKKDDEIIVTDPDPVITKNYNPMSIGSYWIYDHYEIDTLGNETLLTISDSIRITGDTLINGQSYKVYMGTKTSQWSVQYMLRDSADYVVGSDGIIYLSKSNFTDTLGKGIVSFMTYSYKMEQTVAAITVPAGSFNVVNYQGTYYANNPPPTVTYPRFQNNYYADGIGRIADSYFYYSNPKYYERRLVRYHIE